MPRQLKCTPKNLRVFVDTLLIQQEDSNGRGEFDRESTLRHAANTVIDWMEENACNIMKRKRKK